MKSTDVTVSVCIPTLKPIKEIQKQIDDIKVNTDCLEVIASCIKQSAAKNRNWCIDNAKGDIIIMCDDDISHYFVGWADILVDALFLNSNYSIVSARPIHADGGYCPILGDSGDSTRTEEMQRCIHTPETMLNICGSATIAFWRNCGVRFDEEYQGATYEDSDFCMQMKQKYPDKDIVFANKCAIVHNEERKGRSSSAGKRDYWLHNHNYFAEKWGIRI